MRLQSLSLILCIILIFTGFVATEWLGVRKFQGYTGIQPVYITSSFRDSQGINHVVYYDNSANTYKYDSYDDKGNQVNKASIFASTMFGDGAGFIRGSADGKNLFMLLVSNFGTSTAGFTESSDGGKGWQSIQRIVDGDEMVYPEDMVYMEEKEKLFIFFNKEESQELRMVTREKGSQFSSESIVVNDMSSWFKQAKVLYNTWEGTQMLHVFYVNKDGYLSYIRSSNEGTVWTVPKVINSEKVKFIDNAVSAHKFSEALFAVYKTEDSEPRMVMTKNWGSTFTYFRDFTATQNIVVHSGFTFCGNSASEMLAMMFVTEDSNGGHKMEYSVWNAKTMKQKIIDNPFSKEYGLSASLTCGITPSFYNVIAFVSSTDKAAYKTNLYFGREYGHLDNDSIIS